MAGMPGPDQVQCTRECPHKATIRELKRSLQDAKNQRLRSDTELRRWHHSSPIDGTKPADAVLNEVEPDSTGVIHCLSSHRAELRAVTNGGAAHALNRTIARLETLQVSVLASQRALRDRIAELEADLLALEVQVEGQPSRKDFQLRELQLEQLVKENARLQRQVRANETAPLPVTLASEDTQRKMRRDKILHALHVQTTTTDDEAKGELVLSDGKRTVPLTHNLLRQKVGLICSDLVVELADCLDTQRVADLPRRVVHLAQTAATVPRLLAFVESVRTQLAKGQQGETEYGVMNLDRLEASVVRVTRDYRAMRLTVEPPGRAIHTYLVQVLQALNVTELPEMAPMIVEMRSKIAAQREFTDDLRRLLGLAPSAMPDDIVEVLKGQGVVVFTLGLITGTGTTLMSKIMYNIDAVGSDGLVKKFEKPIFQTWLMFAAMIFALPIQYVYHWHLERQWHENGGKINGFKRPQRVPIKTYFILALPAAFDLIATYLANLGLLYVTVSVFQLMKCTVIIFVLVLKDHLRGYMWIGIGLNTAAAIMVGFTSFQDTDDQLNSSNNPGLGILMIILSCFVQSAQYVFEEKLMGDGIDTAPPLVVVGMEGFWGLLFTSVIVYPIAYFIPGNDMGSYERFDDALVMLGNSPAAQIAAGIFVFVILGYNVFAVFVTFLLNSIWHAILDNFRPITVWGTDLLLFYVFTPQTFGEAWTLWSWLELGGMLTLLVGTAVYNGTIQLPGHYYDEPVEEVGATSIRTPLSMTSSALTRSPMISKNAMKAADIARRTPDPVDRERVRKEYMTEFHRSSDGTSASRRIDPAGHTYGSMDT
ncbi:Drug/Metabolite Transporter (DMT) Superfamily [Achlya hypogyna]|uniref:Drug/Metabolite Transporter (DMT) Superfamily n=1 Tax=Achlya hypogyna TaxID=1202772 RepID=A0A1V9YKJ4_ACHHY|nr:Drug/Metabolite Transporter (DMT) Superfamily [Achlya hypogyna]